MSNFEDIACDCDELDNLEKYIGYGCWDSYFMNVKNDCYFITFFCECGCHCPITVSVPHENNTYEFLRESYETHADVLNCPFLREKVCIIPLCRLRKKRKDLLLKMNAIFRD